MNHAESQDLLLDLAYGELDAARAAEVEAHVEGCPDCARERREIVAMRKLAAPLRELEEPSQGFDQKVLAAARAEASLQSDGLPGQVIETTAAAQALGVQAGRIDAAARVTRPSQRRKPRWLLRAAVGGSAAAAAALALVVTTRETKPPDTSKESFSIQIRATEEARREAEEKAKAARTPPAAPPPVPLAAAPEPSRDALEGSRQKIERVKPRPTRREAGSGGDASAPTLAKQRVAESDKRAASAPAKDNQVAAAESRGASPSRADTAVAGARPQLEVKKEPAAPPERVAPPPMVAAAKAPEAVKPPAVVFDRPSAPTADGPPPAALEEQAQQARHGGNYRLAAALYRKAAALRSSDSHAGDVSTAAWDLAHAVECLSAAGELEEGRTVRAELGSKYPAEKGAYAAARRALQEF